MPSKFSTLAIRLAIIALGTPVFGAQPSPTPIPNGYFRFWNMLPANNGTFNLCRFERPAEPLIANATSFHYSTYQGFPLGRYRLAVFRTGNQQAPLKTFDLDLKANNYFTILISAKGIELFDDTNDPKVTTGSLFVRDFFSGPPVSVSIGTQPAISLSYGQSLPLTGQPLDTLVVKLNTKLPNGSPAESQVEVEFKTTKRATLLIIPDSYGRFRPRVTPDGINP